MGSCGRACEQSHRRLGLFSVPPDAHIGRMSQLPARILHDLDLEVATLAQASARVDLSWVARSRSLGAGVEAQWARLPDAVRAQVEDYTRKSEQLWQHVARSFMLEDARVDPAIFIGAFQP